MSCWRAIKTGRLSADPAHQAQLHGPAVVMQKSYDDAQAPARTIRKRSRSPKVEPVILCFKKVESVILHSGVTPPSGRRYLLKRRKIHAAANLEGCHHLHVKSLPAPLSAAAGAGAAHQFMEPIFQNMIQLATGCIRRMSRCRWLVQLTSNRHHLSFQPAAEVAAQRLWHGLSEWRPPAIIPAVNPGKRHARWLRWRRFALVVERAAGDWVAVWQDSYSGHVARPAAFRRCSVVPLILFACAFIGAFTGCGALLRRAQ